MSRRDRSAPKGADAVEVVDGRTTQTVPGAAPWRPLAALGLAVVAWLPSARALLAGDLDINSACVRFLVAVGVAWVALTVVATVVRGYLTPAAPPAPRRRRTDTDPAAGRVPTRATADSGPVQTERVETVDAIDVTATEAPASDAETV